MSAVGVKVLLDLWEVEIKLSLVSHTNIHAHAHLSCHLLESQLLLDNRRVAYVEENVVVVDISIDSVGFLEGITADLALVMEIGKITVGYDCASCFIRYRPMRPEELVSG